MKKSSHLPSLPAIIRERLNLLGVSHLPAAAMAQLERDVLQACIRSVERAVTAPRIGRAVAAALTPGAANEQGLKGGTPLTSSLPAPKAREGVAGPSSNFDGNCENNTPLDDVNQLPGGAA